MHRALRMRTPRFIPVASELRSRDNGRPPRIIVGHGKPSATSSLTGPPSLVSPLEAPSGEKLAADSVWIRSNCWTGPALVMSLLVKQVKQTSNPGNDNDSRR